MKHLSEEELVFHYYNEGEQSSLRREDVEAHLASCADCRSEYQSLQRVLNVVDGLPVPERRPTYGESVWRVLEPKLGRTPWFSRAAWFRPHKLAVACGVLFLLVVSFFAGRRMAPTRGVEVAQEGSGAIREKILLVALGDHLDRSQMILVELANGKPGREVDISDERKWAEDLLSANRLYRQTAASAGEQNLAVVLDDLERFLVEVAHSPSKISGEQFEELRKRIESQGILFKVRLLGSRMREPESALNLEKF
jgi:hypothetical protein